MQPLLGPVSAHMEGGQGMQDIINQNGVVLYCQSLALPFSQPRLMFQPKIRIVHKSLKFISISILLWELGTWNLYSPED